MMTCMPIKQTFQRMRALPFADSSMYSPEYFAQVRKQGFGVPIERWFRGDLGNYAHDLLDSQRARERGIFDPQFIRNVLRAHASTKLVNHSSVIRALLCLELWIQTYMDRPSIAVERRAQTSRTRHR
jgi:asparagine synthase (glutamine-hydrolysing)